MRVIGDPLKTGFFPSSDRSIVWLEATVNVTVGGSRELCRIKYLQAPVPAQIPGKGSEAVLPVLCSRYGSSTSTDVGLSETGLEIRSNTSIRLWHTSYDLFTEPADHGPGE